MDGMFHDSSNVSDMWHITDQHHLTAVYSALHQHEYINTSPTTLHPPLYRRGSLRGVRNGVAIKRQVIEKHAGFKKQYPYGDEGRVIVYMTTLGINRRVWERCRLVRAMLNASRIAHHTRDLYLNASYIQQLAIRLHCDATQVTQLLPQVFVNGEYFGDYNRIETLCELGVLADALPAYVTQDLPSRTECTACHGQQYLVCRHCNGSKRSQCRPGLRCIRCDSTGLFACHKCGVPNESGGDRSRIFEDLGALPEVDDDDFNIDDLDLSDLEI